MARDKKFKDLDSEPPRPPARIMPPPVDEDMDNGMDMEDDDLDMPEPGRALKEPERPLVEPGSKSSPPLFVKVDKYESVIRSLQELRSYALSLRDALDALADIEKELKVGMDIAHKALDRVNVIISSLDSKLLRTEGVNIEGELRAPREVEGYIKNVYNQIERLKGELRAID